MAVTRDDTVIALIKGDPERTHGERLPGEFEQALTHANVRADDLDLLAVASGPGAFTGLRIGLAAIQGLAMVLEIDVVGVSALDALAFDAWPRLDHPDGTLLVAWKDAQRGEVFSARYGSSDSDHDFACKRLDEPIVAAPASVVADLRTQSGRVAFAGEGAVTYRTQIEAAVMRNWELIDAPTALAPVIAAVGWRLALRGAAGPPHTLQPLYVRRPDAELERSRRSQP